MSTAAKGDDPYEGLTKSEAELAQQQDAAKVDQVDDGEHVKSDLIAYLGAAGAAIFLGLADYFASLLGAMGLNGIWAEWFGCIAAWSCYHFYYFVVWAMYKEEGQTFFSKD